MSKFNLGDLLKDAGVSESDTAQEQIEYIPLDRIDPDPENFYSLDGLGELAANIETVGLQQPLRVRATPSVGSADSSLREGAKGGRHTVVSGHRRRAALMLIRDGGSDMFKGGVPCIVESGDVSREMQELRLIYANSSTRVLTSAELSRQAERVEELLYKLQEQGVSFPGRMRDHVAAAVNASKSKLARLHAIRNKLVPELLAEFEAGNINESVAYRCSQESAETQKRIWEDQGSVLHHLTADGISSYVAQLRSFLKPKPAAEPVEEPEDEADEGDEETATKPKRLTGKPKLDPLPWETEMWRRVKKRREELGLSIADVYETDDDYAYVIEGYENGEPCEWDPIAELSLDDDERNDFADLLQCSLDYLYSRSDIPETAEQLLNNLPQAELCEAGPRWNEGAPPDEGYYAVWARYSISPTRTWDPDYEILYWSGEYWTGRPGGAKSLDYDVYGWYPLPDKGAVE